MRQAVRQQMGLYVTLPFYAQMFVDAGFPEAKSGKWSDGMIDAVAIHGSAEQVVGGRAEAVVLRGDGGHRIAGADRLRRRRLVGEDGVGVGGDAGRVGVSPPSQSSPIEGEEVLKRGET